MSSLNAQESVLNMAYLVLSAVNVPDSSKPNNVLGAVLDEKYDRDLNGAIEEDGIDEIILKRRPHQLQECCCTMKQAVPANVLEVFPLSIKFVYILETVCSRLRKV